MTSAQAEEEEGRGRTASRKVSAEVRVEGMVILQDFESCRTWTYGDRKPKNNHANRLEYVHISNISLSLLQAEKCGDGAVVRI